MNQIYNNRYLDFKNYCNKNTHWLDKFSIPIIKQNQENIDLVNNYIDTRL